MNRHCCQADLCQGVRVESTHRHRSAWEAAEDNLKQALSQCERLDIPWERGQTLYCLGLYYRRHADVVNRTDFEGRAEARVADLGLAHSYFEQALGFFESLKAEHDEERARLALTQDSKAPV